MLTLNARQKKNNSMAWSMIAIAWSISCLTITTVRWSVPFIIIVTFWWCFISRFVGCFWRFTRSCWTTTGTEISILFLLWHKKNYWKLKPFFAIIMISSSTSTTSTAFAAAWSISCFTCVVTVVTFTVMTTAAEIE